MNKTREQFIKAYRVEGRPEQDEFLNSIYGLYKMMNNILPNSALDISTSGYQKDGEWTKLTYDFCFRTTTSTAFTMVVLRYTHNKFFSPPDNKISSRSFWIFHNEKWIAMDSMSQLQSFIRSYYTL